MQVFVTCAQNDNGTSVRLTVGKKRNADLGFFLKGMCNYQVRGHTSFLVLNLKWIPFFTLTDTDLYVICANQ
jgi:hypothetical protein